MALKLSWGILATGSIARTFARALQESKTGELIAVGSRSEASANAFGDAFDVPRRHGSYEALLGDPDVQAVYIATPHPMHAEWAIKCAEAGKHVLCEKPIGINHAQAVAIIKAARRRDVFLMEAFMYRCHPQTARLVELIREKAIGEVRVIQAAFSFDFPFDPSSRLLSNEWAGGGILDVGCYPTSMARLIAGVATGGDFAEPIEVKGTAHLGRTGVDEYAVASLRFPGNIIANLACGVQVFQDNVLRVFGSEGHVLVPDPWTPGAKGGAHRAVILLNTKSDAREIVIESDRGIYAMEADTFAEHLDRRRISPPAMTWDDSLGNMKTLDRWRESIGLVYQSERPTRG